MTNQVKKNYVVCEVKGCNAAVHVNFGTVCPKHVNQTKSNQSKGEVNTMKTVKMSPIVNNGVTIAFRAELIKNEVTTQAVVFGYSAKGGNQTFVAKATMVDGKEVFTSEAMDKYKFMKRIESFGPNNLDAVRKVVFQSIMPKQVTEVISCMACNKELEKKEVSFNNRHRARLEKAGMAVGGYLCQTCQGKLDLKAAVDQIKEATTEKKEAAANTEQSSREARRESARQKREENTWHVPANLADCIRNFPIDIDTQSVEVVQLLRALKRVFGNSHEAAAKSSTQWHQEQYIAKATEEAERSEAIIQESEKPHNARKCSVCKEEGHTKRNCPTATKLHNAEPAEQREAVTKEAEIIEASASEESATAESTLNTHEANMSESKEEANNTHMDDCFVCDNLFPANMISKATGCCPECHKEVLAMEKEIHGDVSAFADHSEEVAEGSEEVMCHCGQAPVIPSLGTCPSCYQTSIDEALRA